MDRLFNIPRKLLVIAQSGRMLAQMLVDAGFVPIVVDCFADLDTRQLALATVKLPGLGIEDIKPAVNNLRISYGLTHVVYGSGFEHSPESLAFLEQDWVVLGNRSELFRQLQDKQTFFQQLSALAIPYPDVVFSPPKTSEDWLIKPMQGEGGAAIIRFDPKQSSGDSGDCYWQRRLYGRPFSVLFAAGGGQVKVLGFNRQRTRASDEQHRFIFAGIDNHAELSTANQRLLSEWLTKLIAVYPLQGLGSLDFIVEDGRCYLLEINARIPASAQLYGRSIFITHLQSCLGQRVDNDPQSASPMAYRLVYARRTLTIQAGIDWPDWVTDRPEGGAIIGKGQPICSIIAAHKKPSQLSQQLRKRRQYIEHLLKTGR